MSVKRKMLTAAAALTTIGGLATVGTGSASAATPQCGDACISIFSKVLGTPAQPNFVEDILGGVARVGQRVILKQASGSDPSEDIIPHGGTVADFYAAGMVSAEVNSHYGSLRAVQQEYAPLGVPSGLCVGLASVAYQDEPLTLQPCSVPATTVWILNPALSHAPGYFPIINASTPDFSHPFAMDLRQDAIASDHQRLEIHARRLQFLTGEKTLPDSQLWGAHFGALQ
ncbi:hypothetical protein EV644_10517 [Kribbella orskensis]|uniref:Uncharacterized protein n=1 Tax=Kribbella orskensis TaxID=2512216 RepID=A0ABY2BKR5_9ACTN|nr:MULTISPECIES: hypothetical protein [Kribbella]TCN40735.1 hypothetical protein EV642_10417 [Kribbella sp. VKM Ac-2500]TCO23987.1 hypothetical protein EV644_10517 [Kribbella orskensis]